MEIKGFYKTWENMLHCVRRHIPCHWNSQQHYFKNIKYFFYDDTFNMDTVIVNIEHAVAQLVEALRYKPEIRRFDFRWCHWSFSRHNPSGRTMALGLTQPLTEMSTENISWGVKRPVHRAENLTTFMCLLS